MKQPPRRPAPPRPLVNVHDDDDDDAPTMIFDRTADGPLSQLKPPAPQNRPGIRPAAGRAPAAPQVKPKPPPARAEALFPLDEIDQWEHTMMMDNAPLRVPPPPAPAQPLGVPRPPKDRPSFPAPASQRSQNKQAFDAIAQHISQPTPPPPASRQPSKRPPANLNQTKSAFPPPPGQLQGSGAHDVPPPAFEAPDRTLIHRAPVMSPQPPPVMSPYPPHVMSATPPPVAVSQSQSVAPPAVSPFARSADPRAVAALPSAAQSSQQRASITTSRTRPPPIAGLILFAAPMAVAMLVILALAFS